MEFSWVNLRATNDPCAILQKKSVSKGRTFVVVELRDGPSWVLPYPRLSGELEVTTLRPERLIDTLFYVAIIVLLAILFVNFGCAINKAVIIAIIKRPIGPAIGSLCQIGFLPLISYGLGLWLFPGKNDVLRLTSRLKC